MLVIAPLLLPVGYVAKVFGVESHVDFSCDHVIKVTPPMPRLHISLIQSQLMVGVDSLVGQRSVSPDNSPQVVRRIQNKGKSCSHLGSLTIMDGQQSVIEYGLNVVCSLL